MANKPEEKKEEDVLIEGYHSEPLSLEEMDALMEEYADDLAEVYEESIWHEEEMLLGQSRVDKLEAAGWTVIVSGMPVEEPEDGICRLELYKNGYIEVYMRGMKNIMIYGKAYNRDVDLSEYEKNIEIISKEDETINVDDYRNVAGVIGTRSLTADGGGTIMDSRDYIETLQREPPKWVDNTYYIDGEKFYPQWQLCHDGKLIGWMFDANGFRLDRKIQKHSVKEHITGLLRAVRRQRIELLLVYYEVDGNGLWEEYVRGHYVRTHTAPPTFNGYEFDKKKLTMIYNTIKHEKTKEIPLGPLVKCLNRLTRCASKELVDPDETELREDEIENQMDILADLITKMQQTIESAQTTLNTVRLETDESGGTYIGKDDIDSINQYLDQYRASIPDAAHAAYEVMARRMFPFYDFVSKLSQQYLVSAVAMEMALNSSKFDVCPIYFELCRVFENELDRRIFNEYRQIVSEGTYGEHYESDDRAFKAYARNIRRNNAEFFVPESIKISTLLKLDDTGENSCDLRKMLFDLVTRNRYNISKISTYRDYMENKAYVEARNVHVHPMELSMEEELEKLQQFKRETVKRLRWLVASTTPTQ